MDAPSELLSLFAVEIGDRRPTMISRELRTLQSSISIFAFVMIAGNGKFCFQSLFYIRFALM
jgi:hypothetical protein